MGHPGPLGPSRIFLQKAVASGGSNLARLGELGGNHLPYFAINRGGSEEERGSAPLALLSLSNLLGKIVSIASFPVFPASSSNKCWWRLRAYSFRGTRIPRVTRRPPAEGEPSSRAFLFENLLLLVVPTATICSSKGMIPLETIKRDITTLGIIAKNLVISMGTNQTGKRFYQVKVKSLDTTSIKELGRLMEPLQMQAFRKTYGKILELTIAEVSIEAIVSLTQYYDQPLRCFTFGDFQLVPTIEEFEEILGCPLGGRKPYLSSGCLPSLSRIATVVKDSARGLDRIKQTRNGIAGLPQKYLEDKARGMANQGDWVPFMDVLALLIFGVVLFPNVDGLVDLAAIDAFLAYHHSKESPVVAVLADLFDTFDRRCEKSSARIICCLPALCVWLVSHLFQQDTRHPCPLLSHRSCTEKRRIDWDQLLAGIGGRTISWFPRWKEGKEGVLFSCGRYPNIPLVGTRGCINYNPALAIRQLGYPMRGAPTEESMSPFLVRDLDTQNSKTIQRIHKAWETPLRKDQELRGIRNGIIGGYHEWLKVHIRGLDWLAKLKVVSEEDFEAPEEDEEELIACSRSKRSLSQRLCETETNMLAIIAKYQEELGLATAHEHRIVDENRAAYPYGLSPNYSPPVLQEDAGHIASPVHEREPPQQPDEVHKDPQDYARRDVEFYPPIPEGPAPGTLPQPNIAASPIVLNFPPRPLPEFTLLPMTYEDHLPSLIANHLAVVTPGRVLEPPFPKWYDPNATCKYHGGVPGHSVEKCLALKYKVQHLMDAGWLTFQEDRPNVRTNPLANHGGGAVNAVESDRPHRSKPLRDVATPRRFIFEALQKGGVIPHSGCKEDSCLLHSGEMHDMETCLEVEELLQRMIDQGRLEVGIEGKEEQHICMQSTEGSGVVKPKPLVIYFTKSATSQKPGHPLIAKPVPFPYQNSHAVPWRYTPPGKKEEEVTDVGSLSAKVTNITGLSGVTRSGRVFAPPDLPVQPADVKGKGKVVEEQDAVMMARVMLGNGYEPGMGLGKDNGGITSLIKTQGNRGKYGLGYKPTQADMKRSIAGRKNSGQSSRWRQESEGSPPCHISRSFISAGLGDKGQVFAICKEDVPSTLDLVRPCPPDFQLGNWRVEERSGIYATSIMKLASKRSRKDKAAEGTSSAPEYDSHCFRSAVHQQRFEAIKGWSFLRERRVQLRDDEYTDFQEEIGRRRWASLVTPMAKFDPEIVLEFYANAWPTEEGVRDMRSWVRGQWIPFDADAIGQLLGYPLVLEEGQECEYGQRRNRSDGFDEEAIAQLLCIPGQDFARTAAGRRVRIMRTNMTTLTQIWMTLLLSNILPTDHNSDLPMPKSSMWLSMAPTRHPLDPDKSNRALGFPALITGLCQSFGVPVAPTKVIRPPITRAFIEKYCTQRQAQGDAPQAAGAPPPPHQAGQAGAFDMEQYLRHLVRQQAANHRAHTSSGQRLRGPEIGPRPKQERHPQKLPATEKRPTRMRRWPICFTSWEGVEIRDWEIPRFIGENTETFSSLTSYQELRRSEFLMGGYVGAKASLLSTAPLSVTMTQELVARGDTLRGQYGHLRPFRRCRHLLVETFSSLTSYLELQAAGPMTRRDQVWSFCTLVSSRGGGPDDTRRYLTVIRTLLSSRGGGPDDKQRPKAAGPMIRGDTLRLSAPFCHPEAAGPMTRRDQVWSFCTLVSSRGGGPDDTRRYLTVIHTLLSSRGGGPDDTRRYLTVIRTLLSSRSGGPDDKQRPKAAGPMIRGDTLRLSAPFCHPEAAGPMTSRDQVWSFCTLVSSRGGGPDDTRRYLTVIRTLLSSRGGGPDDTRRYLTVIRTLLSSRGGGPDDKQRPKAAGPMIRGDTLRLSAPFCHPEAAGTMASRDKVWSFCTLVSSRGGGPDDTRRYLTRRQARWQAETKFGHSAPLYHPEAAGPMIRGDTLRLSAPFFHPEAAGPMASRDQVWSFCTLVSSRGGGPDDTRRYLTRRRARWQAETKFGHSAPLYHPEAAGPMIRGDTLRLSAPFFHPEAAGPMPSRDQVWSFCTLVSSRGGGPDDTRKYPSGYPYKHSFAICPLGPSRIFLQKAVASGGSNLARLAEALPKRFRNVYREEFRKGFNRSSTFFIRSSSFFDLQRFFWRFPQINVGGDSACIPFVEHASRESRVALPPKVPRRKSKPRRFRNVSVSNYAKILDRSSRFIVRSSFSSVFNGVATYPSADGRRVTRGMRVPRKEYARSRHQRLFEENVGKTGKDAIYELLSERFGSCIYARGSKIGEMLAAQLAQASQVASSKSNSLLEESSGGPKWAWQKNVYTDNHSGISARQRDSKVSMTDLVSAEDDVNLRVSSSPPPLDDKGCRMTKFCLCAPSDTTGCGMTKFCLRMSSGPPPLDDKGCRMTKFCLCAPSDTTGCRMTKFCLRMSSGPPPLDDKGCRMTKFCLCAPSDTTGCRMTKFCLRMSSGPPPLDDKGCRMTKFCLCAPSDTTVSEWQRAKGCGMTKFCLRMSSGPPPLDDKGCRMTKFCLCAPSDTTSPVESPTVATYPSAGGRRVTRGMRVPRKEYARSRHQRLFEENVGKTGKDAIYELLSERFGSCIYARGRYLPVEDRRTMKNE
ncbi:hypothetical protein HKD37_12G034424 [Glycine soja]